ncbi:amidohydrolase family protein [Arthrobacter sp. BB-1]|uniref:metal-dependent hydrolase family protein n=1 Tax=unclassified Arthrobacter TaxID=235627 RepID=UPI001111D63A|nr:MULTISPECIES: amidohydrolase family protein [unclassified Arthrobacter]TNB67226.1 amidohydrolase family protein [Arthrobacter sp. BB-1]
MKHVSLVLRNAQVLDVRSGDYRKADVVMNEGRIENVGVSGAVPPGVQVVDVTGKFVLPGLIDGHVHVTALNTQFESLDSMARSYVASHAISCMGKMLRRGFTSVRDAGGADFGLALAQREGLFLGPRLFYGGKAISQTGGHADFRRPGEHHRPEFSNCCAGIGRIADGVSAVREAARDELRQGAHHIKIMASGGIASPTDRVDSTQYSEEEIAAIVSEATAANRYVAAHAYMPKAINRCLELGVRSIEHGSLLDQSSVDLFLKHEAILVPTLVTHWAMVTFGRDHGLSQEGWEKAVPVREAGLEALRLADKKGVKIAFGSDLLGALQQHQNYEFELRSKVQSNLAVIQSATLHAAHLVERDGELGEVSPGAIADLIIVDGDPLVDIGVLSRFEEHRVHVIQEGRIIA